MNDIALSGEMVNNGAAHWMSRMLAPRSIAIVGASPRAGSMGQVALQLLQDNFYAGKIYLVNPRYETIGEFPAYPDLYACLLYTSPSPRDGLLSRMPSSA